MSVTSKVIAIVKHRCTQKSQPDFLLTSLCKCLIWHYVKILSPNSSQSELFFVLLTDLGSVEHAKFQLAYYKTFSLHITVGACVTSTLPNLLEIPSDWTWYYICIWYRWTLITFYYWSACDLHTGKAICPGFGAIADAIRSKA